MLGPEKSGMAEDFIYRNGFDAYNLFLKTLPPHWWGLLFVGLMSHLSHVKQMYSQHLTHELILCIQITRGREDF